MSNLSLHIGLNRVDPFAYGGWSGLLQGCHNDALAMAALAQAQGFAPSIMLDAEATTKAVLDALYVFAKQAQSGETVMLTYSGHGGQIPDYSRDEKDGLDETWCLWDTMLSDDDLHRALGEFRKGVRVIVVSDSCHAGTVIKSAAMARAVSNVIEGRGTPKAAPTWACREAALSGGPLPFTLLPRARVKASTVLLAGCQDNQFSWDGEPNGLFTQMLLSVWADGAFGGNLAAFRKAIASTMPPDQTPSMLLMGGRNKAFTGGQVFSTDSKK